MPPAGEQAAEAGAGSAEAVPAPAAEATPSEASAESGQKEPAEEPKPILLWRPGRFESRQRGRGEARGRPQQRDNRKPAGQGEQNRFDGKREGGRGRFERKFDGKPGRSEAEGAQEGRRDKRGPGGKGNAQGRPSFQQRVREERPVRIDPDSPFAKLAALRDQLKK